MKTSSLAPIVILLAAVSAPAQAQIYKWVDEGGKTHYSDTPPAGGKQAGTVTDRVSVYTPAPVPRAEPAAAATAALSDKVDRLERQLATERLARQQVELAAYNEAQASQAAYLPYGVPYAVPVHHRHPGVFRPFPRPKVVKVVGPGIVPGTFNGPNAITAGNFTVRTSVPAAGARGTLAFAR